MSRDELLDAAARQYARAAIRVKGAEDRARELEAQVEKLTRERDAATAQVADLIRQQHRLDEVRCDFDCYRCQGPNHPDPLRRAADNGEPELDDQISITGQYPPTGDTVWPPADNEEPE